MLSGPMPTTSSSATLTETVGMVAAVMPALRRDLKKATLESPFSVLNTASGLAWLSLLTTVEYSVWPSGVYSSPTTVMPLACAYALMILLAVRGNT